MDLIGRRRRLTEIRRSPPRSNRQLQPVVSTATPVKDIQSAYAVPQTQQQTVAVTYAAAQTSGNLNVVIVGWNDTTAVVNSVKDSKGNAYQLAVGPTLLTGNLSQSMVQASRSVCSPRTATSCARAKVCDDHDCWEKAKYSLNRRLTHTFRRSP
jgi:hypothetical protein